MEKEHHRKNSGLKSREREMNNGIETDNFSLSLFLLSLNPPSPARPEGQGSSPSSSQPNSTCSVAEAFLTRWERTPSPRQGATAS